MALLLVSLCLCPCTDGIWLGCMEDSPKCGTQGRYQVGSWSDEQCLVSDSMRGLKSRGAVPSWKVPEPEEWKNWAWFRSGCWCFLHLDIVPLLSGSQCGSLGYLRSLIVAKAERSWRLYSHASFRLATPPLKIIFNRKSKPCEWQSAGYCFTLAVLIMKTEQLHVDVKIFVTICQTVWQ